jgi:hypothetical protein
MRKPVYFIPANAPARDPDCWHAPNSLCRTCVFQFLLEPYCDTVHKIVKFGIIQCEGYVLETRVDLNIPLPSYTEGTNEK